MLEVYDFLTTSSGLAQEYTETIHFESEQVLYQYDWLKNNQFFLMKKGIAKIEIYRKRRWEFETLVAAGEFAGIENLINRRLFCSNIKYRIVSVTHGEGLLIEKDYFLDHVYANPSLFHKILENVTLHHIITSYNLREKKAPLKQRLADVILELVMLTSLPIRNNQVTLPFPFSEDIISSLLRVPVHHVKEILSYLEKEEIVTREHDFQVMDYNRLGKLSNLNVETFKNMRLQPLHI
ncbi:helix-turn-helix domain-containing protein [Listeria grandensis]|uniref:helix-turn-helix domain-containing protein n=1 Tax=Listeria grandensis TaxID=1494963 RepID=UPI00164E6E3B|nr:helix-turn-helix domain-containing protein [Listeria grandensis]MBC6314436.1 Crp/Fnr family transcriptional regulator [Listeria grandensis]